MPRFKKCGNCTLCDESAKKWNDYKIYEPVRCSLMGSYIEFEMPQNNEYSNQNGNNSKVYIR